MMKKITLLAMALILVLVLGACGKKENTTLLGEINEKTTSSALTDVKDGKVTINVKGNSFDYTDDWANISAILKKAGGNMSAEKIPSTNSCSEEFKIIFSDAALYICIRNTAGKITLTNLFVEAKTNFVEKDYTINGITLKTPESDIVKVYGKKSINGNEYLYLNNTTEIVFEKTAFGVKTQVAR